MRPQLVETLQLSRVIDYFGDNSGLNGRFLVQGPCGCELQLISYDGIKSGWEQVSVDTDRRRSPNWLEMCFAKDLFWDEEECVVQFHPPLSQYVKFSRYCLHLWKPTHVAFPAPPSSLIGPVGIGPDEGQKIVDAMLAEMIARL